MSQYLTYWGESRQLIATSGSSLIQDSLHPVCTEETNCVTELVLPFGTTAHLSWNTPKSQKLNRNNSCRMRVRKNAYFCVNGVFTSWTTTFQEAIMRTPSRTIHAHVDGHVHVHMKTHLLTRPQNQFARWASVVGSSVFCVAGVATRRIVHRDVFFNCCCWCWEQRFHTVSGCCQ